MLQRVRPCVVGAMALAVLLGVGRLPAHAACAGDCDASGSVSVDDLVVMVNVALGDAPVSGCTAGDLNGDGLITVDEIVIAVSNAQDGCPGTPTPTATATAAGSPTNTPIPTFAAHGSVEQIYVTDADPGAALAADRHHRSDRADRHCRRAGIVHLSQGARWEGLRRGHEPRRLAADVAARRGDGSERSSRSVPLFESAHHCRLPVPDDARRHQARPSWCTCRDRSTKARIRR